MTPDDVRALRALVAQQRGHLEGYEFVVGGSPRRADGEAERSHIRSLAKAGATW